MNDAYDLLTYEVHEVLYEGLEASTRVDMKSYMVCTCDIESVFSNLIYYKRGRQVKIICIDNTNDILEHVVIGCESFLSIFT